MDRELSPSEVAAQWDVYEDNIQKLVEMGYSREQVGVVCDYEIGCSCDGSE